MLSFLPLSLFASLLVEPVRIDEKFSLAHLANLHTPPYNHIYLLNNQSTIDIPPIVTEFNYSVSVSNGDSNLNNLDANFWFPPNAFSTALIVVLCDEDVWQCQEMIATQIKRHDFNPRRKVLMELVKSISGSRSEIREIQTALEDVFRRFWRINLLNVVIRIRCAGRVQSFSFNPFEETFLINLTDR